MDPQAADSRFRSEVQDLHRRMSRARLLAQPAVLGGLAYVGLLVCYWSGLIGKESVGEMALVLLAVTWVALFLAAAGMQHVANWQCPACHRK